MRKFTIAWVVTLAFCAMTLIAIGVGRARFAERAEVLGNVEKAQLDARAVSRWVDAVRKNDAAAAAREADLIAPALTTFRAPPADYLRLARESGVSANFFNPPFNALDFWGWQEAFRAHDITQSVIGSEEKVAEKLFRAVSERVKVKVHPENEFCYPSRTWERKEGDVTDIHLLFSALMEQAGYDVAAIYLFAPDSPNPLHLFCEIRGKGEVHCCDFFTRRFWGNVSASELAARPELLKPYWKPKWIERMGRRIYAIQASALDYRDINSVLAERVKAGDPKNAPVFGQSPQKRLETFRAAVGKLPEECAVILWPMAFKMIQPCPAFDQRWKETSKPGRPSGDGD